MAESDLPTHICINTSEEEFNLEFDFSQENIINLKIEKLYFPIYWVFKKSYDDMVSAFKNW